MEDANSREGSEAPSSEEDFYGLEPPSEEQVDMPAPPAHTQVEDQVTLPVLPAHSHVEEPVQAILRDDGHATEEQPNGAPAPEAQQPVAEEHVLMNGTANGTTNGADVDDHGDSSSEMDV
ncbi:hypothetical protein B0A55_09920, partial [Friedmanniomyces simplex]